MIYCMSDIHGEADRFHAMLQLIKFSAEDTLYIIGDVIDRHPGGVDILQEIIATPNMIMLLGNHEEMCLKTLGPQNEFGYREMWKQNGGSSTYRELLYHTTHIGRDQILNFISKLPVTLDIEVNGRKFHLVHGWPADNDEDRIWGRPMDGIGEIWEEDVTPIIGHTPTIYLYPNDHESPFEIYHSPLGYIAIDCGCGNKTERRRLACLRLDDMKEYYI